MIYRAPEGRIKDAVVFWHAGRFHLFAMYTKDAESTSDLNYRNVWSAESEDGVHWRDLGCVIEDTPFLIIAMAVHRVGDLFVMNHGSLGAEGAQNVIRFWHSRDLRHWSYAGADHDLYPDTRWYARSSRLDCMAVVRVARDGKTDWYGYATGPGGFLRSHDGLRWEGVPKPPIDWCGIQPPPAGTEEGSLEIGGCTEMDGRFYLAGGWFNTMGMSGYGTFTLVADGPAGPFRPDPVTYRLCGNSVRWVALWARFCRTDSETLVNGYMYDGFTYERGRTWLPPLKRAVVDGHGHLRLGYWPGNEALKGRPIDLNAAAAIPLLETATPSIGTGGIGFEAQPEVDSRWRLEVPTALVLLDAPLPVEQGVVIEGTMEAHCRNPRVVSPGIGFYLEEIDGEGTTILWEGFGLTRIGATRLSAKGATFTWDDVVGPGCATPAGIVPGRVHRFRLLLRGTMFESYLDDLLVQTFNTTHQPDRPGRTPRRLGLLVQNGIGSFGGLRAWRMNL